jgi:general secretion pathway protein K
MNKSMRINRGFALIFTLWVLLLVTVIGMSFSYSLKIERQSTVTYTECFQAEIAALSGTKRAILALLSPTSGPEQQPNQLPYSMTLDNFEISTLVRSEAGKVNLNQAPIEILTGLFGQFTTAEEAEMMAAALIDWRDPDSEPIPNGAEEDAYSQAGYSYAPTNRPLNSIPELSQIIGFNSDLIARITPFVTVHSNTPKIDPFSATATTLTSLPGIEEEIAQRFIEKRNTAYQQHDTVDLDMLSPASEYLSPNHGQNIVNIVSTVHSPGEIRYNWEASVLLEKWQSHYRIIEWTALNE